MVRTRLAEWLSGLGEDALTALLDRRPDVALGRAPTTLGELAERLDHPASVLAALRGLTTPGVQAVEALCALGERRTRTGLVELLANGSGAPHEEAVDAVLEELAAVAVAWPGEGDRLGLSSGAAALFPSPLALGPPARQVWGDATVEAITGAVRALGGRAEGRKAEKLETLLGLLADPALVRGVADHAPPTVAAGLRRMAWPGPDDEDEDDVAIDRYDPYDRYDPEDYRQQQETERWGAAHGLLFGRSWGFGSTMPAEVALALRGPVHRAPFTPSPPAIPLRDEHPGAVESAAAAAITSFLAKTLALLDRVALRPVPQLAGGGVGVRELGRLTKALRAEEVEVRLSLVLAAAAGLLFPRDEGLRVSDRFEGWRRSEPAAQAATLLQAWWDHPDVPTRSRDADGRTVPVLHGMEPCAGCQAGRFVVLLQAASLPAGKAAEPTDLCRAARWHRPMVHVLPQDAAAPLAGVWHEAELLGAVAAGALSTLGAALLGNDADAVVGRLRAMLPAVSDTALFGSDLTALVSGTPSSRVAALLDASAARESSGGAITWRFSPASVRRALDAGIDAAALAAHLGEVSERELPQPLTYLIGDVGRRHGRLRLCPAASIIRSDDTALLAEVAADRRLTSLGLRVIAPTVLTCDVPLEAALARLRDVGYFPVADGVTGPPVDTSRAPVGPVADPARSPAARSPAAKSPAAKSPAAPRADRSDLPALSRRLLTAGDTAEPSPRSRTARELAVSTRRLTASEIEQLAAVVDHGGRVRIAYAAASGAVTRRVIRDPQLDGHVLSAWCELRDDERVFSVSGILSVTPVG